MIPEGFFAWASATALATIVASVVAGRVARRNSERKILIENITQERAKWRGKIRDLTLSIHKAAVKKDAIWLAELKLTLALSLNPVDHEDNLILEVVDRLMDVANQKTPIFRTFRIGSPYC